MKNRAKSVSNVVYLETLLTLAQYDRKKNKFMNKITHTQLAETFRYSTPNISYMKYRSIKNRLMNSTNGKIVLPNIPINENKRGRKSQIEQLIKIVEKF